MTTTDVITNAIPGNPIHNGTAVVEVSKTGLISLLLPVREQIPVIQSVASQYINHFDDPTYYTA